MLRLSALTGFTAALAVTLALPASGAGRWVMQEHRRVLSRDAGVVTISNTFDATTGEFISGTFTGEKGPHPDLESDFELFCNVMVPALT